MWCIYVSYEGICGAFTTGYEGLCGAFKIGYGGCVVLLNLVIGVV